MPPWLGATSRLDHLGGPAYGPLPFHQKNGPAARLQGAQVDTIEGCVLSQRRTRYNELTMITHRNALLTIERHTHVCTSEVHPFGKEKRAAFRAPGRPFPFPAPDRGNPTLPCGAADCGDSRASAPISATRRDPPGRAPQ